MSDILIDVLEVLFEVIGDSIAANRHTKKSNPLFAYRPRGRVTVKKQTSTNEDHFTPLTFSNDNSFTDDSSKVQEEDTIVKESEPTTIVPTIMAMDQLQAEDINEVALEDTQTYEVEDDPIDQYQNNHGFSVNKAKLEILLLSYIYTEDDGKLSFSEKSKIKSHFKSFKEQLNDEDMVSIKELITMEPSLNNIRAHINQNLMNDNEVDFVLNSIQDFCGLNKDYKRIMTRVKKSLKNTINY